MPKRKRETKDSTPTKKQKISTMLHEDILHNIFAFLPLDSLIRASLTSKTWNKVAKHDSLYTPALLKTAFNFEEDPIKPNADDNFGEDGTLDTYILYEWKYQIFIYWDDYDGEMDDENYIIKKIPMKTKGGILIFQEQRKFFDDTKSIGFERFKKIYKDVKFAHHIGKTLIDVRYCTESDSNWYPFIAICDEDEKLSPTETIIQLLEPHEKIKEPIMLDIQDSCASTDNGEKLKSLIESVKEPACFQIGAEECNPFVAIWVGKTENGNLVGALASGAYT